jgi:hypothetical protein
MVNVVAVEPKTKAAATGLLASPLHTIAIGALVPHVPSANVITKVEFPVWPVPLLLMFTIPKESLPKTDEALAVVPKPVIVVTFAVVSVVPRVADKRLNGVSGLVAPVPPSVDAPAIAALLIIVGLVPFDGTCQRTPP